MSHGRRKPLAASEGMFPASFLPRNVGRAADEEMEAVLAEDKAIREAEAAAAQAAR